MICKCCRERIDFVTFADAKSSTCTECREDHDRRHPRGWRDGLQPG